MVKKTISVVTVPVVSMMLLISIAGCSGVTLPANDNVTGNDNVTDNDDVTDNDNVTDTGDDNDNVTGDDNDNGNDNGGGEEPAPVTTSFKNDIEPILTRFCGTCHTLNGIADLRGIPVRLDGSDGFDGLFNGSSVQDPSLKFVVAGDPDSSLAYLKVVTDTPPVGARMPLSSPALSQAEQDLLRTWIEEGAEDN